MVRRILNTQILNCFHSKAESVFDLIGKVKILNSFQSKAETVSNLIGKVGSQALKGLGSFGFWGYNI